MDGLNLASLPMLIVAEHEEHAQKVRNLFVGTEYSNLRFEESHMYEEALSRYLSSGETFGAIIVVAENQTAELDNFIGAVTHNANGPLIIISDESDVQRVAKAMDVKFIVPLQNLVPDQLVNIVAPAWEYFNLKQSIKRLEGHYKLAEQRFRDVADHFSDWLWEVDSDLNIVFSSSRKRPVREAQVGAKFVSCFLPDEQHRIEDDFQTLLRENKAFHDVEYWSFDAYGARVCWSLTGVPIEDNNGEVIGFRGVGKDISSDKASVDQLYHLSNHDQLTGLFNRTRFFDEVRRAVRSFKRHGEEGALLLIDLDKFKYINDAHGYEAGDKVIMHIARVLKDAVRSGDFVARVGGDVFGVLLYDVSSQSAKARAQGLMSEVKSHPCKIDNRMQSLSVSVAVARYPADGTSADELLSRADLALNAAKRIGSNRLQMYDTSVHQSQNMSQKLEWLDLVNRCLNEPSERTLLYFQPIVHLNAPEDKASRDGFYEVLVRLIDDNGNIVTPVKFIETAEEFGVVSKLDRIVVSRALTYLNKWHKEGRQVRLAVNISTRTFDDEAALAEIRQMVSDMKIKPGTLVFEITETSVLRDLPRVKEVMADFRTLGVHFALDDCGVGYSSFSYIRQLELEYIKIDGSFIRELHKNSNDEAFVRAMRDVARRMQVFTVAEMVEEEETVDHLKRLGIDFAQGYHFGMPSPSLLNEEEMDDAVNVVTPFPRDKK